MEQRVLRVLALFGFCIVFGFAVWILNLEDIDSQTSLAQVGVVPGLFKEGIPKESVHVTECIPGRVIVVQPPDFKPIKYDNIIDEKQCIERTYVSEKKYNRRIFNCFPSTGQCVCDESASDVPCSPDGAKVMQASSPTTEGSLAYLQGETTGGDVPVLSSDRRLDLGAVFNSETSGAGTESSVQVNSGSSNQVVSSNSGAGSGQSVAGQIDEIAKSDGDNTAPGGSGNTNAANRPAYRPSQTLTQSGAFNLGSLFSGLGGGSGGSSGGGTVVAYGPSGPAVHNNRNFDAVSSQINFPPPRITAEDLIKQLAEEGKKQQPHVAASDLEDKTFAGKIADTARAVGGTLLKPLGDLFNTAFAPESGYEEEVAQEEAQETGKPKEVDFEKQTLELDVLDLLLIPGDPRIIFDPETFNLENLKKDTNPFFDGALVRTNPWERAREIADAERTTDPLSRIAREGDGDMLPAPFENFEADTQDAMQEAIESSKPQSAFTAMRLTVRTVSSAVTDLFKNIAASLFWWL